MRPWKAPLLALALASIGFAQEGFDRGALNWDELAGLPEPLGVAGPFVGIVGDRLLLAGGANFPGGRPWDGHPKVWHSASWILDSPEARWRAGPALPAPLAYGVSLSMDGALYCLGGGDAGQHSAACYELTVQGDAWTLRELPDLPVPLAFAAGAALGRELYVLGGFRQPESEASGAESCFLRLDLDAESPSWEQLPSWPGPGRALAVAGALGGEVFLFGGVRPVSDASGERRREYLSDAYAYDVASAAWRRASDLPTPLAGAPSPAPTLGGAHLLIVGGDDGTRGGGSRRDAHPGFRPQILGYHPVTDRWAERGSFPVELGPDPARDPAAGRWPPVTTPAVDWPAAGGTLIASGEVRPGVRSARVWLMRPQPVVGAFRSLDWFVLGSYLVLLVAMGVFFARRGHGTHDFFLAGQRIPAWAAGVSIFGTQLSAITFLSIPAKSFSTDWLYLVGNLGIFVIAPLVAGVYLPFFRRMRAASAYAYLERRFSYSLRIFGTASFSLYQLARMGVVLYLPALALAAATGLDVRTCILVMGVLCTIYTVLGGIEAVIWTDVLQVFVLIGGALIMLFVIAGQLPGGLTVAFGDALDASKLRIVDPSWDLTRTSLLVITLSAVFNNLVPYTTDQAVVQRMLSTPTEQAAKRAVWTNAWLSVPASLLFFALGTALWAFYREHPAALEPTAAHDQLVPWFVVRELPAGVAGLVVAGVFAAAMSSLDSAMNSIATAFVTDIWRRARPAAKDAALLRVARGLTILLGLLGTLTALALSAFEVRSLLDVFLVSLGLLGGPLAGLFALGVFARRVTTRHAWAGIACGVLALLVVRLDGRMHGLTYAAVGALGTFACAWISSWLMPSGRAPAGSTIHDLETAS